MNFVLRDQFAADLFLIARGLVAHSENELPRPDIFLRVAVTVQAPLHLERGMLRDERHTVHSPMTDLAAHALVDVDAVVEIDEIGEIVHSRPVDGLVGTETGAHRFQRGTGAPNLRVAVHAGLGGRDVGEAGGFDGRVAIPAIDTESADVVRVAERNRLLTRLVGARHIIGSADFV